MGNSSDPSNPNSDRGGPHDVWRTNPENCREIGSTSSVNLKDLEGTNEVDQMVAGMSSESTGI